MESFAGRVVHLGSVTRRSLGFMGIMEKNMETTKLCYIGFRGWGLGA